MRACSRCDTRASLERRVCILTSGRRAPSSHPARRRSCCHRRVVHAVRLKIARFPFFLDPLTRQESAARAGPLPPRKARLSWAPAAVAALTSSSSSPAWKSMEPFLMRCDLIHLFSIARADHVCRDPAVVTSPEASSQPPQPGRGRVCRCVCGGGMIQSACGSPGGGRG